MSKRSTANIPWPRVVRICLKWVSLVLVGLQVSCSAYQLQPGQPIYARERLPENGELVGLSLSGGGNRSAIYSAYVIELLASLSVPTPGSHDASTSFLDRVQYISSVSGGSFASAYYGLHGHSRITSYAMLATHPDVPGEYQRFFSDYHNAMRHNWELPLFLGIRFSTFAPSNASRLAGELDHVYVRQATLGDLDELQSLNRSPYLIFNATNYDDGRRFVMTTLARNSFCVDVEGLLREVANPRQHDESLESSRKFAKDEQTCRRDVLTPDGFDSVPIGGRNLSVDASKLGLSNIVATSGAFPVFVGPLTYETARSDTSGESTYLHLIDGGLTDNAGVESLAELFLGKLIHQSDVNRSGLIVEIDASLPFDAVGARISRDNTPVATLVSDIARPSDIQELRASIYRHDLWTLAKASVADNPESPVAHLTILKLQHTEFLQQPLSPSQASLVKPDAEPSLVHLKQSLDVAACKDAEAMTEQQAHDYVVSIPTRYALPDCAESMLRLAACWSVHLHQSEIGQAVAGSSSRRADPSASRILEGRLNAMCPELAAAGAF